MSDVLDPPVFPEPEHLEDFRQALKNAAKQFIQVYQEKRQLEQALDYVNLGLTRAGVGEGSGITGYLDKVGQLHTQRDEAVRRQERCEAALAEVLAMLQQCPSSDPHVEARRQEVLRKTYEQLGEQWVKVNLVNGKPL